MNDLEIQEMKNTIKEIINSKYPSLDTRKGTVVNDLLISLSTIGPAYINGELAKFEICNSLKDMEDNPESVDEQSIEAILSNWNISRKIGKKSSGNLKILVDTKKDYFLASGTIFNTKDNNNYILESDVSIDSDDLFIEDDNFFFIVLVQSENIGSKYTVEVDTVFFSDIYITNILSISSIEDFSLGIDQENIHNLIIRAKRDIGIRGYANSRSIKTTISEKFPDIDNIEVLGHDDREMQRDTNNIGIKIGGKTDIYIRTINILAGQYETTTDENGIAILEWSEPVLRISGYSLKNKPTKIYKFPEIIVKTNDIKYKPEFARFSIFESIEVETKYEENTVILYFDYINNIRDIQQYSEQEFLYGNPLVKTFMPCFISINIKCKITENNISNIKNSISLFINSYKDNIFYVSQLVKHIQSLSYIEYFEMPIKVIGKYYKPDGNVEIIESYNKLTIKPDFFSGYSDKTFSFYNKLSDINVEEI